MAGTQYGPTTYQKVFGGAWYVSAPYTLDKEPGFYRVIYDWEASSWTTQIGHQLHENGTFLIGEHLIFPPLGYKSPTLPTLNEAAG
ncbi:hypothetical protein N7G274_010584 [Stereocaulon virgatum]|uniref:Uncharacterized protein n=1 Tax=Stereocaulon virgatum TaxID=373712 RepID=A0ABR3ZTB6_9LECA